MEISLIPTQQNLYAKKGVIVRGASVHIWLEAMQRMAIAPEDCSVFALPEKESARFFGCLIVSDKIPSDTFSHNVCQLVQEKLFIPDYADLSPKLTEAEWQRHFPHGPFILLPETGFFALETPVDWHALLSFPMPSQAEVQVPSKSVSVPTQIKVLMVEHEAKPAENPFDEKEFPDKLPFNVKKVMRGNQREIDKYLKFLGENPEAALKHAVPLDILGKNRDSRKGSFTMNASPDNIKRIFVVLGIVGMAVLIFLFLGSIVQAGGGSGLGGAFFMLILIVRFLGQAFGNSNLSVKKSSGSFMLDSERFRTLKDRYNELAEQYESKGDYRKAAHIYHKLLENPHKAAQTLEKGKLYAEAAHLYLKCCKNEPKAAECFREAKMYGEASRLFLKMDKFEEAADLLFLMGDEKEAFKYYKKTAEDHITQGQYIKAALIYSKKMDDYSSAQRFLLEGWNNRRDGAQCLNLYFYNIRDEEKLREELLRIYHDDMGYEKAKAFLAVLKGGYENTPNLQSLKKELAYEIVAAYISRDVNLASELIFFNREDLVFVKDVMKYKLQERKLR